MKCFKDIFDLVKYLINLVKNMIYQLNAMLKKKHEPYEKIYSRIMFTEFFDKIGEGLAILVTLDIIVHENKQFYQMWIVFNKMIIKARKTPEKFGSDKKAIRDLEKFCSKLTTKVLNGQLFITFLQDLLKIIEKELPQDPPSKNEKFADKYLDYINAKVQQIIIDGSDPS